MKLYRDTLIESIGSVNVSGAVKSPIVIEWDNPNIWIYAIHHKRMEYCGEDFPSASNWPELEHHQNWLRCALAGELDLFQKKLDFYLEDSRSIPLKILVQHQSEEGVPFSCLYQSDVIEGRSEGERFLVGFFELMEDKETWPNAELGLFI